MKSIGIAYKFRKFVVMSSNRAIIWNKYGVASRVCFPYITK